MTRRLYKPQELLDELGTTEPDEIDLEAIAQFAGALVVRERLMGAEARLVGTDDKAIITVNDDAGLPRQRFSIGHELGHWMYHRDKVNFQCNSADQNGSFYGTDRESTANDYAKELLLPTSMFKPRLAKRPPTLDTVKDLAGVFRTSLTATATRVVELGAWPSMVVCSSKDKRLWFKGSSDVAKRLWPHRRLSEDTLAYALLQQPGYPEATAELDADAWIDHENAADYVLVGAPSRSQRTLSCLFSGGRTKPSSRIWTAMTDTAAPYVFRLPKT